MRKLPRAKDPAQPFVVTGRLWNRLADTVERLDKLEVNDPLELSETPGGKQISARFATSVAPVKVTGTATGGGKYNGKRFNTPTIALTESGNLSESELGVEGADCYIFHSGEVGKSTHDLASASYLPLVFVGLFRGVATDGKPVYMTDGQQWKDCVPSGGGG